MGDRELPREAAQTKVWRLENQSGFQGQSGQSTG